MDQKKITEVITLFITAPLTVASIPLLAIGWLMWPIITFSMGFLGIYEVLSNPRDSRSIGELVPITVPLGTFGLYSIWHLSIHFMKNGSLPKKPFLLAFGLFASLLSASQLIINTLFSLRGGEWLAYVSILLIGIIIYLAVLLMISKIANKK